MYFLASALELSISLWSPGSFKWRMIFKKENLELELYIYTHDQLLCFYMLVHSHWYWWFQFKAELSILVSSFFMYATPSAARNMTPISLVCLLLAQLLFAMDGCAWWISTLMWTLLSSELPPCPLPSFAGLPPLPCHPARLSLGCLVTVFLSSWSQHSHIFPSLLLTPEFWAGFSRKKERKKEGRLCCSQTYFLTPSWRYITLCYSVPPKYCYVVGIPLHSFIKEFRSHFLSVGWNQHGWREIRLISVNEKNKDAIHCISHKKEQLSGNSPR